MNCEGSLTLNRPTLIRSLLFELALKIDFTVSQRIELCQRIIQPGFSFLNAIIELSSKGYYLL